MSEKERDTCTDHQTFLKPCTVCTVHVHVINIHVHVHVQLYIYMYSTVPVCFAFCLQRDWFDAEQNTKRTRY